MDPTAHFKPQFKQLTLETRARMVRLPDGQFAMGSSHSHDEDARPVHRVEIRAFWLDAVPVTNREFARFVDTTGFVSSAERRGESLVFDRTVGSWLQVSGASWRHPQGPNRFALYDMAGNAWQWCADWYAQDYYGKSPAANPPGPSAGEVRVRRGGCWLSTAHLRSALRVSHHNYAPPGESASYTGFRCAKNDQ